ncbi:MAG TPA: cbb3-type cytochrome c oxidase subunit I [Bryobacteraceae bacterium]|nr:cbb3-type cytochrome c oxidase subunit I [Bryobacteraceae bacterium]
MSGGNATATAATYGDSRTQALDAKLFSAFVISATFWLLIATAAGVLVAFEFSYPALASSPWLSFGRLRAVHTNGTFFGWASVALVGVAMWTAARSSGVAIQRRRLAWAALWAFNIATALGTITLDLGMSNGSQEYREWIRPVYVFLLAGIVLSGVVVYATVNARRDRDIYIGNWYTLGGFVFATLIGLTAFFPFYQRGLGQVAVQGFYIHNAVGMWFTFLGLGIAYYALPKLLNRPIYSYALGILGFWTQLAFYPMIGAHHFLFSPLPWWIQSLAVIFSVGMIVPVWTATGNFWLTMHGRWTTIWRSYALPFIWAGIGFYFLSSTQGSIESVRSVQAVWHFTNFTVGHSHLTMYGFVSFLAWGGIYAMLPKATGKEPSRLAAGINFWLALLGVLIYVSALSITGTIQGLTWATGNPFIASVQASQPYWIARAVSGSMMYTAHIAFAYNVWKMTLGATSASAEIADAPTATGVLA